jgi:hypothetical protein
MTGGRISDVRDFYTLLGSLGERVGGVRTLSACSGRLEWPLRGVYFFMEDGEVRSTSGTGPRVVRVGTHALNEGSGTKLWTRLSQHRGQQKSGGGNHRGSIFRLIVGTALIARNGYVFPSWGRGNDALLEIRSVERALESEVSKVIGSMSLVWLAIDDKPGAQSLRGYIERNAIALLSNVGKEAIDPPSENWLGHSCDRQRVRASGLWNQNHVEEAYDPGFISCLKQLISDKEHVK